MDLQLKKFEKDNYIYEFGTFSSKVILTDTDKAHRIVRITRKGPMGGVVVLTCENDEFIFNIIQTCKQHSDIIDAVAIDKSCLVYDELASLSEEIITDKYDRKIKVKAPTIIDDDKPTNKLCVTKNHNGIVITSENSIHHFGGGIMINTRSGNCVERHSDFCYRAKGALLDCYKKLESIEREIAKETQEEDYE